MATEHLFQFYICAHTHGLHGSPQHGTLDIVLQGSPPRDPKAQRHAHVRLQGEGQPQQEGKALTARGAQLNSKCSRSEPIKRWQRRGSCVKTVTACWPRGPQ